MENYTAKKAQKENTYLAQLIYFFIFLKEIDSRKKHTKKVQVL